MTSPLGRVDIGARAPDFALPSAAGPLVRLSAFRGRVTVLEWTSPVCPFTTKKYERGAMQALQRATLARGAAWLAVNTAGRERPGWLSPAAARGRVRQTGSRLTAFLLDETGDVGRLYGARTTPTVYVIGADGRLLYQGAVDNDAWASSGPKALAYVREALDDVWARRPVRRAESRSYGCPVEY